MQTFRYEAPTSLDAALALLAREAAAEPARRPALLAGGTDLIVQMRGGLRAPATVIDVKRVPELARVELGTEGVSLGAAVPCAALRGRDDLRALWPGLVEAAELIGSMQIQGRATVVGNLCNASPAADTVPSLLALGARVRVAGARGAREVAVSDFCVGPGQTALAPDELATAVFVPRPGARSADAYLRFTPRAEMDIAVVGAAVSVDLDEGGRCGAARVALGAVAERALLVPAAAEALLGTRFEPGAVARAVEAARAAARPIDDKRGTALFRRHVAGVLVARALERAAARALERVAARAGARA